MGRRVTVGMILFIILLAVVKAHMHFIRLLILAAAGLGGLYMLHLLAQDYNKIRQPVKPAMGAGGAAAPAVRAIARLLFRRSADGLPPPPPALAAHAPLHPWHHDLTGMNEIPDLDYVLKQDPKECARMVVCELATKSRGKLLEDERAILDFLSVAAGDAGAGHDAGGRAAFQQAAALGRRWRDSWRCADEYSKCPYTAWQVLKLLRTS